MSVIMCASLSCIYRNEDGECIADEIEVDSNTECTTWEGRMDD